MAALQAMKSKIIPHTNTPVAITIPNPLRKYFTHQVKASHSPFVNLTIIDGCYGRTCVHSTALAHTDTSLRRVIGLPLC